MKRFLDAYLPPRSGRNRLARWHVLGSHDASEAFTHRPRKGLAGLREPLHCCASIAAMNRVVVAPRSEAAVRLAGRGGQLGLSIDPPQAAAKELGVAGGRYPARRLQALADAVERGPRRCGRRPAGPRQLPSSSEETVLDHPGPGAVF